MAAPAAHINVSGTWKAINKMHVNVSGTWKRVNNAYINVSGTWKKFLASASPSSFSGSLSATGATNTITGTTRTYTLGAGNSGQVTFDSVVIGGTNYLYSKNGGAFTSITEDLIITLANSDTLAIRGTGMTPSTTTNECSIKDVDTGTTLELNSIVRS